MAFATLYIDDGNLLGFYEDLDAARADVLAHVEKHPETAEDFGLIELDDGGRRVGDFQSGAALTRGAARHAA
jgi:hypothetical protein